MFDVIMDHDEAKDIVESEGWDHFIEYINDRFSHRDLYSCSQHWYDDQKYICKLKGSGGDVLIGWEGVHD